MDFNILVTGGACDSVSGLSAVRFCEAAVAAGHRITQVFFYEAGVTQANALLEPLSDEFNPLNAWRDFAEASGCSLVVCVSAGERRGVIGSEQADELGQGVSNLGSGYEIAGLGSFYAACLESDRTVTFR